MKITRHSITRVIRKKNKKRGTRIGQSSDEHSLSVVLHYHEPPDYGKSLIGVP